MKVYRHKSGNTLIKIGDLAWQYDPKDRGLYSTASLKIRGYKASKLNSSECLDLLTLLTERIDKMEKQAEALLRIAGTRSSQWDIQSILSASTTRQSYLVLRDCINNYISG